MNIVKMKVGTSLACGFALVLLLLVAVTGLGISRMAQIQQRLENVVNLNNVETRLVIDMRALVNDRTIALKSLSLLTDASDMQPEIDRINEQTKKYVEAETRLDNMYTGDGNTPQEEKSLLASVKEQEAAATPAIARAMELWLGNKPEDATKVLIKEIRPVQKKWLDALTELAAFEDKQNMQAAADAKSAFAWATTLMLTLGGIALLVGIAAAYWITSSLLRQLGGEPSYAAKIAAQIAAGDLAAHIETKLNDRTSLLVAMKSMRDSLVDIVGQVRIGTDAIANASGEIASGNLDLSSRTEQQAGSLEETASSMEELTSTVKQNADNARQANQLGGVCVGRRQQRRRGGVASGRYDGLDQRIVEKNRRHHRRHRRHRVSDQYPGAECRSGSGARRRTGARIRGGGSGSAQSGATLGAAPPRKSRP